MSAYFGIHFGNSTACIALCKDDDRVEIVANDTGDRLTPTTAQWTPGQCLVGRGAVAEQFRHLTSTVVRNKQLLNPDISDEEFNNLKSQVPYKIHKNDGAVKYELLCDGKQNQVPVKDIAFAVFKKLHSIAVTSVRSGTDLEVVITVPLNFSPEAISSVREIAEKAGFSVIQIIDEPSAAVLNAVPPSVEEATCVVVRIGGVSLDVTVLSIEDSMYTVLSSVHKFGCGGRYITEKLRDFLVSEFTRQYRGQEIAERGKYKLENAAETAKQILSIQNMAQCSAESVGGGLDLNCSVSRPRLDNIVSSILPELNDAINSALKKATILPDDVNRVILCGGTTKIPKIQDYICHLLPKAAVSGTNSPDEVIALGAAMQARFASKCDIIPDTLSVDAPMIPTEIEFKVINNDDEEISSRKVPAKTLLPVCLKVSIPDSGTNLIVSINNKMEKKLPVESYSALKVLIQTDGRLKLDLIPIET